MAYRTRRTLNEYIAYVKRQRQGHEMYGEKAVKDDSAIYEIDTSSDEDEDEVDGDARNE